LDREKDAFLAVKRGKIEPNDVIVIRYEGRKGGLLRCGRSLL
jgi:dihydroxyacid dehydratase/phosphogluconate dehydratase